MVANFPLYLNSGHLQIRQFPSSEHPHWKCQGRCNRIYFLLSLRLLRSIGSFCTAVTDSVGNLFFQVPLFLSRLGCFSSSFLSLSLSFFVLSLSALSFGCRKSICILSTTGPTYRFTQQGLACVLERSAKFAPGASVPESCTFRALSCFSVI